MAASNLEEEELFQMAKLEPWKGVQVSFNIPSEAALRLKHLADHGDAVMNGLGILSVCIEDQISTPCLTSHLGEPQEILCHTEESEHVNVSRSIHFDLSESNSDGSCAGSSAVENTRKNIAQYLRWQSNLAPSSVTLPLGGAGSPFVCPKTLSMDSPNGLCRKAQNSEQRVKLHSSPAANTEPPLVQSPDFSHLPHDYMAKTCNTQMNFSPFVGLNQVKNTKYASTHYQPVIQAHGYSSRFNFSPPHNHSSVLPHEHALNSVEHSNPSNAFGGTKLAQSPYTPVHQNTSLNKSTDTPYNAFCPQVSSLSSVSPMSPTTLQGNVALSSPMLVNLLKSEAGSNHASKMMPPPLLPSKQLHKRKQRARKSKVMPPANMSVSSAASTSFQTPTFCPSKPSIADVQTPVTPSDFDTFDLNKLDNESYHLPLPSTSNCTLSPPLTQSSKTHPLIEEQSHLSVNMISHMQVSSDVSPSARLSTTSVVSNCEPFPFSNSVDSVKTHVAKNEASLCYSENNHVYNMAVDKSLLSSPQSYVDCKTKHLINPFTGQLEPMPSDDDDNDQPFSYLETDLIKSRCIDKNLVSNGNQLLPKTNVGNHSCHAFLQSLTKSGKHESNKVTGTKRFSDNRIKKYLKSDYPPSSVRNSSDEELCVRLGLDSNIKEDIKKNENTEKQSAILNDFHSLHHVYDSEGIVETKKGDSYNVQYPAEPRVSPLHISLKGHHASVVKHPKKDHIRKRSFESIETSDLLKQKTFNKPQLSKQKSQDYVSHNFSSFLSPKHEVTDVQIRDDNSHAICQKNEERTYFDQKWSQNFKTLFHENVSNSGLKLLPTKDMQNMDFSTTEVSTNSLKSGETSVLYTCDQNTSSFPIYSQEGSKPELPMFHERKYKTCSSESVSPLCVQKSPELSGEDASSVWTKISNDKTSLLTETSLCVSRSEITDGQSHALQQNFHSVLIKDSHSDCIIKDSVLAEKDTSVTSLAASILSPVDSTTYTKSVHLKMDLSDISVKNLSSEVNPKEAIKDGSQHNASLTHHMQTLSYLPHLSKKEPLQSLEEDGTTFVSQDTCNSNSPKSVNSIPSVLCDTPDSHRNVTCSSNEQDELPSIISGTHETSVLDEVQMNQEDEAKDSDISSPTEDGANISLPSHHHFETPPDSRSPVSLNAASNGKIGSEEINTLLITDKLSQTAGHEMSDAPSDAVKCCRTINKALKKLSFESEDSTDDKVHVSDSVPLEIKEESIKTNNSVTISSNTSFQLRPLISDLEPKVKYHYMEKAELQGIEMNALSPKKVTENIENNESLSATKSINLPSCPTEVKSFNVAVDDIHNSFELKKSYNLVSPRASQHKLNECIDPPPSLQSRHHIEDDISVDVKDIDIVQGLKTIGISKEINSPVAKIISLPLQNIPHMIEVPSLHALQIVPKIKSAKIEPFETSSIPSLIPSHGNTVPNVDISTHHYERECDAIEPKLIPVKSVTIHSNFVASPESQLGSVSVVNINMCDISHSDKDKILNEVCVDKPKMRMYSPVKQECDSTISSDESSLDSLENSNENQSFRVTTCNSENSFPKNRLNTIEHNTSLHIPKESCALNARNSPSLENLNKNHLSSSMPYKSENSVSSNRTELSETSSLVSHYSGATEHTQCTGDSLSKTDYHNVESVCTNASCDHEKNSVAKTLQNKEGEEHCCIGNNSTATQEDACYLTHSEKNEECTESNGNKLSVTELPNVAHTSSSHSNKETSETITDILKNSSRTISDCAESSDLHPESILCILSSQTDSTSSIQESSQAVGNSNSKPPSVSDVSQGENVLDSSSAGPADISSSTNSVQQNNLHEEKLSSVTNVTSKASVRITPEISGGNRVRLILKGNLNNLAMANQTTSSSTVVVPLSKYKGVPIKFVTLPGKSSALSVRSTSNPSLLEIIGSSSKASNISSSTHGSPVRLIVSKVSSGKTNVAAMVVKSIITGTTSSLKLIPATESSCRTAVLNSSSTSSEIKSSSAFVERHNHLSTLDSEKNKELLQSPTISADQDRILDSIDIVKYDKNTPSENIDNHLSSLSTSTSSTNFCRLDIGGKIEGANYSFDSDSGISSSLDVVCSGIVSSSKSCVINTKTNKGELLSDRRITANCKINEGHDAESSENVILPSDSCCKVYETESVKEPEISKVSSSECGIQSTKSKQSEITTSIKEVDKALLEEISDKAKNVSMEMPGMQSVRPSFNKNELGTVQLVSSRESKQNLSGDDHKEILKSDSSISLVLKTEGIADSCKLSTDFSTELLCEEAEELECSKVYAKEQYKGSTGEQQAVHSLLVSEVETTYCKCTAKAGSCNVGCLQLTSQIAKGKLLQSSKDNKNMNLISTRHAVSTSESRDEYIVDEANNATNLLSLSVEEFSSAKQHPESDCGYKEESEFSEVS